MTVRFALLHVPSAWLSLPFSVDLSELTSQQQADFAIVVRARQPELKQAVADALDKFVSNRLEEFLSLPPEGLDHLRSEVAAEGHPASALTAREQQVMEMLARSLTNREIAEQLEISVKTVDTHRGHVMKKLGLRNNSELTRFAVKHGYVQL
ncbi:MAG TPA: response regulator transcription factor [Candidatus Udaeobacter sp.]|nr:response regulator transcription factor [Candidatus Udaeobacter sp.]